MEKECRRVLPSTTATPDNNDVPKINRMRKFVKSNEHFHDSSSTSSSSSTPPFQPVELDSSLSLPSYTISSDSLDNNCLINDPSGLKSDIMSCDTHNSSALNELLEGFERKAVSRSRLELFSTTPGKPKERVETQMKDYVNVMLTSAVASAKFDRESSLPYGGYYSDFIGLNSSSRDGLFRAYRCEAKEPTEDPQVPIKDVADLINYFESGTVLKRESCNKQQSIFDEVDRIRQNESSHLKKSTDNSIMDEFEFIIPPPKEFQNAGSSFSLNIFPAESDSKTVLDEMTKNALNISADCDEGAQILPGRDNYQSHQSKNPIVF